MIIDPIEWAHIEANLDNEMFDSAERISKSLRVEN